MKYTIIDEFIIRVILGNKDWENPFVGIKEDSIEEIKFKLNMARASVMFSSMMYQKLKVKEKSRGIKGWIRNKEWELGINHAIKCEKILKKILEERKRAEESVPKD